ncbi:ATP-binding protein [Kangiella sp. M94]
MKNASKPYAVLAINMLPWIRNLVRPSLFWKIFLWFWLATLITVTSIVFLYSLTGQDNKLVPASDEEAKQLRQTAITIQLRKVIDEYQAGSLLILNKVNDNLDNTFIIDKNGEDIAGKEVPDVLYHLSSFYRNRNTPATVIIDNIAYIGPEVVFNRGNYYLLFIKQQNPHQFTAVVTYLYHSVSIWHLLIALGISALVCFALTWYLTRPINQLQKTTQAFARGDLTARAQPHLGKRQDEFADLAEDFDLMAERIERVIQSQKRLMSDVSHELRSPLTRMQIAASLAQKTASPESKGHIDRIELEVERLDEMIGELLQMAALERGHINEDRASFMLNDLLEVIVEDARFEAEAHNKTVDYHSDQEIKFTGYYSLLARAIENVLRNAIRHTPDDTCVTVTTAETELGIEVRICDSGHGVNEEHLEKIFEAFYRPTDARERTSGGAGLGLAIAKRGIEANGGSIKAYNQPDSGLCVVFQLPKTSA